MKPARFEYLAPRSIDEVLDCLARHGADAKLLAGGQSLVPLMNFRLARPSVLIDLNGVAGLDGIADDAHELRFGAMVRQSSAQRSALVRERCQLVAAALRYVGHRTIRNRGTLGGSLAHADPAAELPLVLTALGGRVRLARAGGERWLAAGDFFKSYLTTAAEPDELLVEVGFPVSTDRWGFEEFSRRHGDFALAAVAVTLTLAEDGRVSTARIAVAGGGPTPLLAEAAGQALSGATPTDRLIREVAQQAADACPVEDDLHASAEYRKVLIGVLTERAVTAARSSAAGYAQTG